MLSIMIVSHGSYLYVKQCCSMIMNNVTDTEYELLLYAQKNDKKTISWAHTQNIICYTGINMSLGAAYALLAKNAHGDSYLFLHDDVVLLPQTIKSMQDALIQGYAAAAPYTNRCQYPMQKILSTDYRDFQGILQMEDSVRQEKKAQEMLFLESFCLMISQDAYHNVGGFRGDLYAVGGEDIDISFRLRLAGYRLQLVADYVHHERGSLASQQGENRLAWQKNVAGRIKECWGLDMGIPKELWWDALQDFNWFRGGRNLLKSSIRSCMLSAPLVSVMIPTYNRPALFEKTLKSALAQTYPNIEIIVCDNSTNEDTKKLMQKYLPDERVRYIWNPEAKSKEENFAPFEKLAKGEFLQWCMDDDILLPDKIKKMIGVFYKHPHVTLVSSNRGIIDVNDKFYGKVIGPEVKGEYGIFDGSDIARTMLFTTANIIGEPSAVLFRRRDLKDHYWRASCREYLPIADVAMWLELLEKGDLALFSEPLSYYRRHPEQEGQQADIVLLARQEWVNLADEYYRRGIFLKNKEDYKQALYRNISVIKEFTGEVLQEVSPQERMVFLSWFAELEKRVEE